MGDRAVETICIIQRMEKEGHAGRFVTFVGLLTIRSFHGYHRKE